MNHSQVLQESLRDELNKFGVYLRAAVRSDNPRISEIVNYIFETNGKMLRPMLVFLAAKSVGEITPETYHAAVTVELLHTASLVHDDVIDESPLRRKRPSVNAVYDNVRAVLVGDYLLSGALRESVKTGDMEAVRIMSELSQKLAEGELNQYAIANEILIDEEEYFRVIDKKTASLLSACTSIGARTAGAAPDVVERFNRLGQLLGIAFQIRDDIFDYYTADVGKPTGNDIREGKITLPLIHALKNAPEAAAEPMLRIIRQRDYTDENIAALLDFAKKNGGIAYAYEKMNAHLSQAEEILASLAINNDVKTLLQLLSMYLKERVY